jgi:glycosyltransferase involved in cell wall biosynthesis
VYHKKAIVSILVPTYQRPDMLARCLDKLKIALNRQSHCFELIVGDNSDLPENRQITESFSNSWAGSVQYLGDSSGRNMQENWNSLALNAEGNYLQYVHDDDYLLPNAGEHLLQVAKQHQYKPTPVKFAVSLVRLDESKIRIEGSSSIRNLSPSDAMRHMLSESSYVRFPSMFLPRTQLIDSGLFDAKARIQDWPTWLEIAKRHGIEERPELTAAYTIHLGAGTNRQFQPDYLSELITLLNQYAAHFPSEEIPGLISKFAYKWIFAGSYRAWKNRDMESLRLRLEMMNHPLMTPYKCPLRWRGILTFLTIAAKQA